MRRAWALVLGFAVMGSWMCTAQKFASPLPSIPQRAGISMKTDPVLMDSDRKTSPDFPLRDGTAKAATAVTSASSVSPVIMRRIADRRFFWMNGMSLGMAVFDVEMTQRCIANHRCREANPVMPSSQAGQLSVNLALVAYSSGVSYWLKKRRSRIWWLPPTAGVIVHSIGVATGFEHQ